MKRLLVIALLVATALSCTQDPSRPVASNGERLNLILVSLDTCRADRAGSADPEDSGDRGDMAARSTPHLDRLADESVRFANCLAQSGLTAPSHLSLLTGQFVHRHGLANNRHGSFPQHPLASVLRERGWRTGAFTGHGSMQEKHGVGVGFETFQSWVGEEAWPFTRDLAQVLPHALAWLDEVGEEPFFLFVHSYDPHAPYWPPEKWRDEYGGWYDGELELERLTHPNEFGELMREGAIGPRELRYIDALYDGEIAYADAALGRLLDGLVERDLLERSIVVFTSDHGEVLGNHAWIGHSTLWEEVLHVPLFVRFPDGRWAGVRDEPVQHVDVLPTLLSALGVPAPPGVQGVDLMPLVRGEAGPSPERMRLARVGDKNNQVAVRFDERWKIVFQEQPDGISSPRLFDLEQDPGETNNLFRTKRGAARFEEMLERYRAFRRETAEDDRRFAGSPSSPHDSEEDLELLRALGYADDDG